MAIGSYDKLKTLCSHGEEFRFHGHGEIIPIVVGILKIILFWASNELREYL